jgi:hypothetical protein
VPETVSNTSPLIYLHLLRRLELLPLLFGKIVVPFQVEQELAQGRVRGTMFRTFASPGSKSEGLALITTTPNLALVKVARSTWP